MPRTQTMFPKRWSIKFWLPEMLSPKEKDSWSSSLRDAAQQALTWRLTKL